MKTIKNIIAETLSAQINSDITAEEIYSMLLYPPDPEMGDLSLPCFKFAKQLKKPPVKIAEEIAASLAANLPEAIQSAVAVNGYLNFFTNPETLAKITLGEVFAQGNHYGSSDKGEGRAIVMDYSSPNIAKPFHMGHLRSTTIGNALNKILTFLGYKCTSINYLGDWGTQFGKVITAYKLYCDDMKVIEENGVAELSYLYVKFHEEAEKDPSLNDLAREWFKKLENGDEEALFLWKNFREISLAEFMKTYKLINIDFDSYNGESFFNDKMDAVVEELKEKNLLKLDDGAHIVDLNDYNMPPCLILKRDGTTLYPTRDIASALYRKKTYNFHKNLYIVATPQSLHFSQWLKTLELMGYEWAKDCVHINFGIVSLEGKMMGTRKGNTLRLQDIFDSSIDKVKKIIEEKNPSMSEDDKMEIARKVGVGAIIFYDLSGGRIKDYDFSWEDVLNFDGNSGPYAQYTYARICGVLKKSELNESTIINSTANAKPDDTEKEMLKLISQFPEKITIAARDYEPSVISRYILDVCALFNRFYNGSKILKAETESTKLFRLKLCLAVKTVLGSALELIGLERTDVV